VRTTVDLDPDTTAAVEALRREQHLGLSQAVNELVRRGMLSQPTSGAFRQVTHKMGVRIDVSSVVDAIEVLEGPEAR
jgi:hypothetical protein